MNYKRTKKKLHAIQYLMSPKQSWPTCYHSWIHHHYTFCRKYIRRTCVFRFCLNTDVFFGLTSEFFVMLLSFLLHYYYNVVHFSLQGFFVRSSKLPRPYFKGGTLVNEPSHNFSICQNAFHIQRKNRTFNV